MPTNKKPRKQYQPRTTIKPLNLRPDLKCELPLQMALTTLGTADFGWKQLAEVMIHAEIVRDAGRKLKHEVAYQVGENLLQIIRRVLDRQDRTQRLGLTGDEINYMRDATKVTLPWVRTVPNNLIHSIVTQNRKAKGLT